MITIGVISLLAVIAYVVYRKLVLGSNSADGIVSTFTKAITQLEQHAEDKIKESDVYHKAAEASLELKAKAEAEVQKAQDYAAKLKGIFS